MSIIVIYRDYAGNFKPLEDARCITRHDDGRVVVEYIQGEIEFDEKDLISIIVIR